MILDRHYYRESQKRYAQMAEAAGREFDSMPEVERKGFERLADIGLNKLLASVCAAQDRPEPAPRRESVEAFQVAVNMADALARQLSLDLRAEIRGGAKGVIRFAADRIAIDGSWDLECMDGLRKLISAATELQIDTATQDGEWVAVLELGYTLAGER